MSGIFSLTSLFENMLHNKIDLFFEKNGSYPSEITIDDLYFHFLFDKYYSGENYITYNYKENKILIYKKNDSIICLKG